MVLDALPLAYRMLQGPERLRLPEEAGGWSFREGQVLSRSNGADRDLIQRLLRLDPQVQRAMQPLTHHIEWYEKVVSRERRAINTRCKVTPTVARCSGDECERADMS